MNWITDKFKRFKPKIKNLFRVKIGPEGKLWENCSCGAVLYKQDLKDDLYVCNKCNKHHRIEPKERFQLFFDEGQYQEISPMLPAIDDPLLFTDSKTYGLRLRQAREDTGQHDSVMLATGKVNNVYLVAGAMNFNFMGGSVDELQEKHLLLELNLLTLINLPTFSFLVQVECECKNLIYH